MATSARNAVRPAELVLGLVLGVLASWGLVLVSPTLLVPLVAVLGAAALTWSRRRDVAVGLACGALAVTAFFAWLFGVVGSGLEGL